jgi:hypothetical protein
MTNKLARFEYSPGQSGNPGGRMKGTRNRLNAQMIEDGWTIWREAGLNGLRIFAHEDPAGFCKMMFSTLPHEMDVLLGPLSGMSDAEFAELECTVLELQARDMTTLPEPLVQSPKKQSVES